MRCLSIDCMATGHTCNANLPDPENYGFIKMDERMMTPRMMTQDISAPELLNSLTCQCKDYCTEVCSCVTNQPCSPACSCEPDADTDEQLWMNKFTISILSKSDYQEM